jgi:hypothetical protein
LALAFVRCHRGEIGLTVVRVLVGSVALDGDGVDVVRVSDGGGKDAGGEDGEDSGDGGATHLDDFFMPFYLFF